MNEQQKEALFDKILRYESGQFTLAEHETRDAFFQNLIDTGTVWNLRRGFEQVAIAIYNGRVKVPGFLPLP